MTTCPHICILTHISDYRQIVWLWAALWVFQYHPSFLAYLPDRLILSMPFYRIIPKQSHFQSASSEVERAWNKSRINILVHSTAATNEIEKLKIALKRWSGRGALRLFCHRLTIMAPIPLSPTLTLTHCEVTGWRMFRNLFPLPRGLNAAGTPHTSVSLSACCSKSDSAALLYLPKAGDMLSLICFLSVSLFCAVRLFLCLVSVMFFVEVIFNAACNLLLTAAPLSLLSSLCRR